MEMELVYILDSIRNWNEIYEENNCSTIAQKIKCILSRRVN